MVKALVCNTNIYEFESHPCLKNWECVNVGELSQSVKLVLYSLVGSNPTIPTNEENKIEIEDEQKQYFKLQIRLRFQLQKHTSMV